MATMNASAQVEALAKRHEAAITAMQMTIAESFESEAEMREQINEEPATIAQHTATLAVAALSGKEVTEAW